MKSALFLSGFLLSLIVSCNNEKVITPDITTLNLKENDTLRNNYIIRINTTSESSTTRLELFANDSLLTVIEESPFEHILNTLEMKDGEYSIKGIFFDLHGNKTEYSCKIIVQNALLNILLGNDTAPYIFVISDELGNLLASDYVKGTGILRIMPKNQYDKKGINFVFSMLNADSTNAVDLDSTNWINCIIHVKRGSLFRMDYYNNTASDTPEPKIKTIKLHVSRDIKYAEAFISTDMCSYELDNFDDPIHIPDTVIYTEGHKLLIQVQDFDGNVSYNFITIDDIPELWVSLSSANKSVAKISMPNTFFTVYGLAYETDTTNRYLLSSDWDFGMGTMYYPPEYFSKYYTSLGSYTADSYWYQNFYTGTVPDKFERINANFEIVNPDLGNFKANVSGEYDFYSIMYTDNDKIRFQISVPESIKEWKLPDLVKVFKNAKYSFKNFAPGWTWITNYKSLDWTNKFFDAGISFEKVNKTETFRQFVEIPALEQKRQLRESMDPIRNEIKQNKRYGIALSN